MFLLWGKSRITTRRNLGHRHPCFPQAGTWLHPASCEQKRLPRLIACMLEPGGIRQTKTDKLGGGEMGSSLPPHNDSSRAAPALHQTCRESAWTQDAGRAEINALGEKPGNSPQAQCTWCKLMFKAYLLACMQNASGVFLDQWVSDILGRGRDRGCGGSERGERPYIQRQGFISWAALDCYNLWHRFSENLICWKYLSCENSHTVTDVKSN